MSDLARRLGYGEQEALVRLGRVDFDYELSEFSVSLPHSCDSWQITRENPTKAEALEDLDAFLAELGAARQALAEMPE